MQLTGKKIVLTGGTSGIGLEVLRRIQEKNQIIVIARQGDRLLKQHWVSRHVNFLPCDLSQTDQIDSAVNQIVEQFNKVDILINNAAVQYTPQFTDPNFTFESITDEIQVNFTSICQLTHLLVPSLLKNSRSIILNVNSGLGLAPKKTSAVYCATKAALNSFSISMRYQLEDTNIRVAQVFMPLVDTPMTEGRGVNKISAVTAAQAILRCIENEISVVDVGKVRWLRALLRVFPPLAYRIMKRS